MVAKMESITRFICDTVLFAKDSNIANRAENFDLVTLARRASHARVLYLLTKNLLDCEVHSWEPALLSIISEGEKQLYTLSATLDFISTTLPAAGIDYLVVKTYKYVPYITFDVDLLVRPEQYEATKLIFAQEGFSILKHPGESFRKQCNCERDDLLRIDLHQGFYWQQFTYLDEDLIWKQPIYRKMRTIKIPTPSLEIEVLLNIVHLLFERRYVTLLDLIYFQKAIDEGFRWEVIEGQAQKYGWRRSLHFFRNVVNELITEVWGVDIGMSEIVLPAHTSLPFMMSPWSVWGIFIEKICATGTISWFDLAYYHFITVRYYFTGRKRLPFYLHWYSMEKLSRT